MAKKAAAKKTAGRKKAAKRELIDTRRDKRYGRRRAKGRKATRATDDRPL